MSEDDKSDEKVVSLEANLAELKQEPLSTEIKLDDSQNKLLSTQTELENSRHALIQAERKYIKMVEANEQLRKENECLSQQLHDYKVARKSGVAVGVQTEEWNQPSAVEAGYGAYDSYHQAWDTQAAELAFNAETAAETTEKRKVGDLGEDGMPVWDVPKEEGQEEVAGSGLSIAEGLKAAATEVLQETGVVYHEESGLYYDYASGYYFDPERSLYYEPNSGVYYLFDHEKQEYKFHSQVDLTQYQQDHSLVQHGRRKNTKKKVSAETLHRREERAARKLQVQNETADIIDTKERKRVAKRILHNLKREEKLAALQGKTDTKSQKRRGKLIRKQRDADKKRTKEEERSLRGQDVSTQGQNVSSHGEDAPSHGEDAPSHGEDASSHGQDVSSQGPDTSTEGHNAAVQDESKSMSNSKRKKKRDKKKSSKQKCSNEIDSEPPDTAKPTDHSTTNDSETCELGMVAEDAENDDHVNEIMCISAEGLVEGSEDRPDNSMEVNTDCEEQKTNNCQDSESELEEGQVSSSTEGDSDTSEDYSDDEDDSEDDSEDGPKDYLAESMEFSPEEEETVSVHYAPCIRVMVTESDTVDVASLFVVTCSGGTIGREPGLNHVITIPDLNISKAHAGIEYREDLKKYAIRDFASQNGTFLNRHRLSEAKKTSAAFPLCHGDVLRLGGTTLVLHIHPGSETCDTCEPGQVLAALQVEKDKLKGEEKVLIRQEREQLRRQQLKQIKKKFGLENTNYADNKDALNNPAYEDKASERRRTKGSDNPYQPDDVPSSVHRPIEETNKGHKLLAKMGWKKGQGLGRAEQGLSEPVQATLRAVSKAGLGADAAPVSLDDVRTSTSASHWSKARERFKQLNDTVPGIATRKDEKKPVVTWVKGETMEPT